MPISFQFGLRTSVWFGPVYLDASNGQILWCVWVEEVGRHFRHAFQVRDTSLKRNTAGETFAAFSVGSFFWYSFGQLAWVAPVHCKLALVAPLPLLASRACQIAGGLQRFAPTRPSIRVQAMAGQTALSN